MTKRIWFCALVVSLSLSIGSAQSPEVTQDAGSAAARNSTQFYHLEFVVQEADEGRVINSRSYSTMLSSDEHAGRPSVRTGSKIPVSLEGDGSKYSYIDVGMNFDCKFLGRTGNSLMLEVTADMSSLATPPNADGSVPRTPNVIRQNRWSSAVVVSLRKATTLFSSDDLTSKRKTQVQLTVIPIQP